MDKNVDLIFVRHGQSYGNANLPDAPDFHPDDPPLTPLGLWQAECLKERFAPGEVTKIYASTLLRTVQTVHPTAEKMGLPITLLPDLREVGTKIGGTSAEVLREKTPLAIPCESAPLPFPETTAQLEARAERAIRNILDEAVNDDVILIATHGGFFGYLLREVLGISLPETFSWQVLNCSVTHIWLAPDALPKLICAGDVSFLYEKNHNHSK